MISINWPPRLRWLEISLFGVAFCTWWLLLDVIALVLFRKQTLLNLISAALFQEALPHISCTLYFISCSSLTLTCMNRTWNTDHVYVQTISMWRAKMTADPRHIHKVTSLRTFNLLIPSHKTCSMEPSFLVKNVNWTLVGVRHVFASFKASKRVLLPWNT